MLRRLYREPLVHFLGLALLIFAIHGTINRTGTPPRDSIVVTAAKVDQMATIFSRTWQRGPTADEIKGMIDDHVKEEILVREALLLGLDQDDTVIRRRLRLKMEFLNEEDVAPPTEEEMTAYLATNGRRFSMDRMLAFEQVFLSPERHGDRIAERASEVLRRLTVDGRGNPSELGDPTMLPREFALGTEASVVQTFGTRFAEAIATVAEGEWTGPVESDFGTHIVRVSDFQQGHVRNLPEVRKAVMEEMAYRTREDMEKRRFDELLKRYDVTVESLSLDGSAP